MFEGIKFLVEFLVEFFADQYFGWTLNWNWRYYNNNNFKFCSAFGLWFNLYYFIKTVKVHFDNNIINNWFE